MFMHTYLRLKLLINKIRLYNVVANDIYLFHKLMFSLVYVGMHGRLMLKKTTWSGVSGQSHAIVMAILRLTIVSRKAKKSQQPLSELFTRNTTKNSQML